MDRHRRRGRRGRCLSDVNFSMPNHPFIHTSHQRAGQSCIANTVINILIMSSLIGVIFLMLDHHCKMCGAKSNLNNLTSTIEQIANNLSYMKNGYHELESRILQISHELPKMEGQIDILEALANTIEKKHMAWNPKSNLLLPNIDLYVKDPLNKGDTIGNKHIHKKCYKCELKHNNATTPKLITVNQD